MGLFDDNSPQRAGAQRVSTQVMEATNREFPAVNQLRAEINVETPRRFPFEHYLFGYDMTLDSIPSPKILITGSRDWQDVALIEEALAYWGRYWINLRDQWLAKQMVFGVQQDNVKTLPYLAIRLISGACPTGADLFAETFASEWGWQVERHPAEWHKYGKSAGPRRNQEMVMKGADVCLAFNRNNSRGTANCVSHAVSSGIFTITYSVNDATSDTDVLI